ncbi:unnamed protein product, partial [Nesidiocoris tenuis]
MEVLCVIYAPLVFPSLHKIIAIFSLNLAWRLLKDQRITISRFLTHPRFLKQLSCSFFSRSSTLKSNADQSEQKVSLH